jgi:hypothetical protein
MDNIEATRARKKLGSVWDLHRPIIEELYQTKQLEGYDGVMELMKRDHNFSARYEVFPLPLITILNMIQAKHNMSTSSRIGAFESIRKERDLEVSMTPACTGSDG